MNVSGKSLKQTMTPKRLLGPLRNKKKEKSQDKKADKAYLQKLFPDQLKGGNANGDDC